MTGSTMEIGSSAYGDITNTGTNYSVPPVTTDGTPAAGETWYTNERWTQQLAYYKKIPELKKAINALAQWTIGKGYKANEPTQLMLMKIKGHGKDTFNSIIENMLRVAEIGGDSYSEIIRDKDELVNLKPLDPQFMRIVANSKGIITRYEQLGKNKKAEQTFQPEDIFHLSRERAADEIHGESLVDALEEIILSRNEAMADYRQVMHRYVKPRVVFKLDTDNAVKISEFKANADAANDKGENLFIPMGAAEFEILSVPIGGSMNPLAWIRELKNDFFAAAGVPQIVVGGSQEMTEATAKIAYMAFEQTVESKQLSVEEQALMQLNIEIELEFPASLQNEMLSDQGKEESMQASTPEDTTMTSPEMQGQQQLTPAGGMQA